MSKPDFEKWVSIASNGTPGLAIVRSEELLMALNDAFNSGLDRAAEIAEGCLGEYNPRERWYENPTPKAIATAIRAEREKS